MGEPLQVVLRLERFEREDAGWVETQALEALVSLVRSTPVFAQCRRAYRLGDDTSRGLEWFTAAEIRETPDTYAAEGESALSGVFLTVDEYGFELNLSAAPTSVEDVGAIRRDMVDFAVRLHAELGASFSVGPRLRLELYGLPDFEPDDDVVLDEWETFVVVDFVSRRQHEAASSEVIGALASVPEARSVGDLLIVDWAGEADTGQALAGAMRRRDAWFHENARAHG